MNAVSKKENVCAVFDSFPAAMQRVRKDANCGAISDWQVATDSEGFRHIFVEDPFTREWFEAYNEGQHKELCHA